MDFCVILLIFSIFLAGAQKLNAYPFEDVSAFANLDHSMGPTAKYGGASIADLNSDGYPDLMFGHHDQSPVEIYINNQDGTFSKVKNFNVKFDAHGINPFRFSRWSPNLHVSISRGGSFGKKFGCPQIFYVESEGREHRWQLLNTMRIEDTLHRDSLTRSPQLHLNRFGRMTSPNFESSEEADELDDSKSETNGTFNSHNMKPLVSIINVTDHINAQYGKGRGRSALFMNLRSKHYASTDAIFINARAMQKFNGVMERNHQKAMRGVKGGRFEEEQLKGFSQNKNWYATYGDLTNNGRIDVISFQRLKIHRVADDFKLRDMTDRLLPSNLQREGVVAVSVLDYNNDLKWDMYLARTNTGDLQWIWKMKHFHDYLLRFSEFDEQPNSSNKSRRFEDVSIEANIPRGWNTRGVTSGDFDNDGWIDILISRYDAPDLLLWNNGNGTFNAVDAGFNRTEGVPGDMVTAVDYDLDGKMDVIVSEGSFNPLHGAGYYRLMRNIGTNYGRALLVRVGGSPKGRATSSHAVVKCFRGDGLTMMRMVGSPGTSVSNSLIETVHFGLAESLLITRIEVQWVDGIVAVKENIRLRENQRVLRIKIGWGI